MHCRCWQGSIQTLNRSIGNYFGPYSYTWEPGSPQEEKESAELLEPLSESVSEADSFVCLGFKVLGFRV